uniref:RING-type E3 ubiquitin transferase n=1 Tax=Nelumbo nucifera TaxID=4432 RepID=A0A822YM94_NELNU|nr:TPA_asm: hypothetical protein HUJ06_012458 [Nelumbo nucifera]
MEEGFGSAVEKPVVATAASSGADQDAYEDACSICLEPFSCEDPATVTNCKHEYHLQCILEWSQRSKECPICWQLLALKDPGSQELLAAVEMERNARSRNRSSNMPTYPRIPSEDFQFDDVAPHPDDLDIDERIMQHLAAAAMGRPYHFNRRERRRSSRLDPSQILVLASPPNGSDVHQAYTTASLGSQSSGSGSLEPDSPTVVMSSAINGQSQPMMLSSSVNTPSNSVDNRYSPSIPRAIATQTPPASPQRSRPSELLSFSESLKSRFSAASARYKESISRSTRGFKEKLLARNNSVKELSREVQREVTASIAGVARMMERLDPTSKRSVGSRPVSNGMEGTSGFSYDQNRMQDDLVIQPHFSNDGETAHGINSNASFNFSSSPGPRHFEVPPHTQDVDAVETQLEHSAAVLSSH